MGKNGVMEILGKSKSLKELVFPNNTIRDY
jgi:hypothetical protein